MASTKNTTPKTDVKKTAEKAKEKVAKNTPNVPRTLRGKPLATTLKWSGIGILGAFTAMFFLGYSVEDLTGKEDIQISMPSDEQAQVVARTEIGRKGGVQISMLDEEQVQQTIDKAKEAGLAPEDVEPLKKSLNNLDAEREMLVKSLQDLSKASIGESARVNEIVVAINQLKKQLDYQKNKMQEIEAATQQKFGEKVRDLGQIFLGQQLVMLDGAYRQGQAGQRELQHVTQFANDKAAEPVVADALTKLIQVTPPEGPITHMALLMAAEDAAQMTPPQPKTATEKLPEDATLWQKIKARVKGWVAIRKVDNTESPWHQGMEKLVDHIAAGNVQKAETLLMSAPFKDVDKLADLRQKLAAYKQQQMALTNVREAYVETYRP